MDVTWPFFFPDGLLIDCGRCSGKCAQHARWQDCLGAPAPTSVGTSAASHGKPYDWRGTTNPLESCATRGGNSNHVADSTQEGVKDCSTSDVSCAAWTRRCKCSSTNKIDCQHSSLKGCFQEEWIFEAYVDADLITTSTRATAIKTSIGMVYTAWQSQRTATILAENPKKPHKVGTGVAKCSNTAAGANWTVPTGDTSFCLFY